MLSLKITIHGKLPDIPSIGRIGSDALRLAFSIRAAARGVIFLYGIAINMVINL